MFSVQSKRIPLVGFIAHFRSWRSFAWQSGYGAFTVSQSQIERVQRYIANQQKHHQRVSFKEEFIALLEAHGVEYDERYLWD
jgi:hypothetical protein